MASNLYMKCFSSPMTAAKLFYNLKCTSHIIKHSYISLGTIHLQRRYSMQNTPEKLDDTISNIYYGVLTPQIKAVKVFSLTTSLGGCIAQPIIFSQADNIGGLPILISICAFVGFFTFVTPFLLHMITKKYVTHLDYNPKTHEYIASVVTFFLTTKKITFTTEDVHVPDVPGMFTSFLAKGSPLFVDPRLFPNPKHYAKIMGYDKPLDLKLNPDVSTKSNKKV